MYSFSSLTLRLLQEHESSHYRSAYSRRAEKPVAKADLRPERAQSLEKRTRFDRGRFHLVWAPLEVSHRDGLQHRCLGECVSLALTSTCALHSCLPSGGLLRSRLAPDLLMLLDHADKGFEPKLFST